MPIVVDRIEGTEVNCLVWIGRVSKAQALAMPARIDPASAKFGRLWISYFDVSADLSELDADTLLALRERLRPVVCALAKGGEFRMILVSNSTYIDPLLASWRVMAATDAGYRSNPLLVRDVDSATQALGLCTTEAERVQEWIGARLPRN